MSDSGCCGGVDDGLWVERCLAARADASESINQSARRVSGQAPIAQCLHCVHLQYLNRRPFIHTVHRSGQRRAHARAIGGSGPTRSAAPGPRTEVSRSCLGSSGSRRRRLGASICSLHNSHLRLRKDGLFNHVSTTSTPAFEPPEIFQLDRREACRRSEAARCCWRGTDGIS
jgi:hypothetical protein